MIAPRTRWWMCSAVIRHVNARVCGIPAEGSRAGLTNRILEIPNGETLTYTNIYCRCENQKNISKIRGWL